MSAPSFLLNDRDPQAHIRPCRIEGCNGLAWDGDICNRCAEEIDALTLWHEERAARTCAARAKKPARRLESFAWASLCIALLWYLLWQYRFFIVDWFYLVTGGK